MNGITFLQETHSDISTCKHWKAQWNGDMFFAHGTKYSCGVAILVGKNVEFVLNDKIIDDKGRFVILICEIQGIKFQLINAYAPNTETEQVVFLRIFVMF